MNDADSLRDFARTFQRFLEDVVHKLPAPPGEVSRKLVEHFGGAATHPVVVESLTSHAAPDLQVGLDAWLARDGVSFALHGITVEEYRYESISLAALAAGNDARSGPVEYASVPIGVDEHA